MHLLENLDSVSSRAYSSISPHHEHILVSIWPDAPLDVFGMSISLTLAERACLSLELGASMMLVAAETDGGPLIRLGNPDS